LSSSSLVGCEEKVGEKEGLKEVVGNGETVGSNGPLGRVLSGSYRAKKMNSPIITAKTVATARIVQIPNLRFCAVDDPMVQKQ